MSDLSPLIPRQPVPPLEVPLVGGGTWSIASASGYPFTMIVVYRGLHCPICKSYLGKLEHHYAAFRDKGVEVIALSGDTEERASRAKSEWGLERLPIRCRCRSPGAGGSTSRADAVPPRPGSRSRRSSPNPASSS